MKDPQTDALNIPARLAEDLSLQADLLRCAVSRHAARETDRVADKVTAYAHRGAGLAQTHAPKDLAAAWTDYLRDVSHRALMAADVLRKRGDVFREHAAAGAPPVLVYDYEVVMEGRDLPRPSNYMLLKILPPDGGAVHGWKRPYIIIDPRAGHGPGIGGFKKDSQVGVALRDGHPVYFVAFHQMPEPDQTLADVTNTEAAFVREVMRRHPDAAKPVIVGNCQGGWATAVLAATHPDLTGPIVLNGAPMSYWAGKLGQDPMRYSGGLAAGVLPAVIASDLGGGVFDGAHLVSNFEGLNPARTWFAKYYDLFANPETAEERFLEFERWWGGFFLMNEAEIRWIVENLFVGNRLGKNEAYLEPGRPIDLKKITAPIIVFASHGDNITPPPQALNWIIDTYADETEIEIRGQRIVYMVHDKIGHLGIFVSSSVARKEHSEMASTLKTIETLSPGLYEMVIEDMQGEGVAEQFTVSFHKRKMADLQAASGPRRDEAAFAGVARLSETLTEAYETTLRPAVQAMVTPQMAEASREMHSMRTSRADWSSRNPAAMAVAGAAAQLPDRAPIAADNPFLMAERLWANMVEDSLDMMRVGREIGMEMAFLSIWANPLALWYGKPKAHTRTHKSATDMRALPEVQTALSRIKLGDMPEAVIRMLILLADSRGDVRADRLQRSWEVQNERAPFKDMTEVSRLSLIREQTLIVHFERDAALAALVDLLPAPADRQAALDTVRFVVGPDAEMSKATADAWAGLQKVLGVTA